MRVLRHARETVLHVLLAMPVFAPIMYLHDNGTLPTWAMILLALWAFMVTDEAMHQWFPKLVVGRSLSQQIRSPAPPALGGEG